jgi:hypothetical protein
MLLLKDFIPQYYHFNMISSRTVCKNRRYPFCCGRVFHHCHHRADSKSLVSVRSADLSSREILLPHGHYPRNGRSNAAASNHGNPGNHDNSCNLCPFFKPCAHLQD